MLTAHCSKLQLDVRHLNRWWRHLVNDYEVRQAWCLLQVKLCDPCLSALKWFVYHARRYTSARLYFTFYFIVTDTHRQCFSAELSWLTGRVSSQSKTVSRSLPLKTNKQTNITQEHQSHDTNNDKSFMNCNCQTLGRQTTRVFLIATLCITTNDISPLTCSCLAVLSVYTRCLSTVVSLMALLSHVYTTHTHTNTLPVNCSFINDEVDSPLRQYNTV